MEEKDAKDKNELKKHSKINYKYILTIGLIAVAAIIILYFSFFKKEDNDNTYKIAYELSQQLKNAKLVNLKKEDSVQYGYQHATLIYLNAGLWVDKDDDFSVAITRYMNSDEAKLRLEFLINNYKLIHNKYDNTSFSEFDDYKSLFEGEKDIIYTNGVYLIRIAADLNNSVVIKNTIDSIIKNYEMEDVFTEDPNIIKQYLEGESQKIVGTVDDEYSRVISDVHSGLEQDINKMSDCNVSDCQEILNKYNKFEKYDEFKDEISKIKESYNNVIKEKNNKISSINTAINKLKKSLSENDYNSIKKQIDDLSDPYYSSYKTDWLSQLSSLEMDIYKKACKKYNYKDLLRYPDKYKGVKVYFFGKVVQKVSSTEYRVSVNCKKYKYISGYSCSDAVYMYYKGDINLLEDDMIKAWGTMNGTTTYTSIWNTTITIPTFNAKYVTISK